MREFEPEPGRIWFSVCQFRQIPAQVLSRCVTFDQMPVLPDELRRIEPGRSEPSRPAPVHPARYLIEPGRSCSRLQHHDEMNVNMPTVGAPRHFPDTDRAHNGFLVLLCRLALLGSAPCLLSSSPELIERLPCVVSHREGTERQWMPSSNRPTQYGPDFKRTVDTYTG